MEVKLFVPIWLIIVVNIMLFIWLAMAVLELIYKILLFRATKTISNNRGAGNDN